LHINLFVAYIGNKKFYFSSLCVSYRTLDLCIVIGDYSFD
jgi:hypothetical protein